MPGRTTPRNDSLLPAPVAAELARKGLAPLGTPARGPTAHAVRLETRVGPALVKLEPADRADRLDAEADSLLAIARTGAIAVPEILAHGRTEEHAFLVMQWIEFGARSPEAQRRLGTALARMHATTGAGFGWHRDNYIGLTPQRNTPCDDWAGFLATQRLAPQLELAGRNGLAASTLKQGEQLIARLPALLEGHRPLPALLHGDLWSGNWGAAPDGTPYLIDPAVYFGDREADLAMTRLFGGFGADFYRAYEAVMPMEPRSAIRQSIYNLYHLLNHFNLFGTAYVASVRDTLRGLMAP